MALLAGEAAAPSWHCDTRVLGRVLGQFDSGSCPGPVRGAPSASPLPVLVFGAVPSSAVCSHGTM